MIIVIIIVVVVNIIVQMLFFFFFFFLFMLSNYTRLVHLTLKINFLQGSMHQTSLDTVCPKSIHQSLTRPCGKHAYPEKTAIQFDINSVAGLRRMYSIPCICKTLSISFDQVLKQGKSEYLFIYLFICLFAYLSIYLFSTDHT